MPSVIEKLRKNRIKAKQSRISLDFDPLYEMAETISKQHMNDVGKEYAEKMQEAFRSILEKWVEVISSTTQEQLTKAYSSIENDIQKVADLLVEYKTKADSITSNVEEFRGPKGDKGDAGYTPLKNRDYFDGKKGDKGDAGSPDTPNQVVQKVNSANEKVQPSSIDGLLEMFAEIKREIQKKGGGGKSGGGMGNVTHQHESISSATTTVTTAYKIGGNGFALWVYYNGQFLARGTDYTVGADNRAISLLFTPQDDTVLDVTYIRS